MPISQAITTNVTDGASKQERRQAPYTEIVWITSIYCNETSNEPQVWTRGARVTSTKRTLTARVKANPNKLANPWNFQI